MEENKKKVSSREAWRLHRRAAKLFYAERPALHAVDWLYAAFKSLSPYVLIYLSAQIIGELTGARDAHRLTVLAVAAAAAASLLPLITGRRSSAGRRFCTTTASISTRKIYATSAGHGFPPAGRSQNARRSLPDPPERKMVRLRSGARARCGDEAADVRFWCSGRCRPHRDALHAARAGKRRGVDGAEPSAVSARLLAAACSALGAAVAVHEPRLDAHGRALRRSRGSATGFSTSLRSWRSATATAASDIRMYNQA